MRPATGAATAEPSSSSDDGAEVVPSPATRLPPTLRKKQKKRPSSATTSPTTLMPIVSPATDTPRTKQPSNTREEKTSPSPTSAGSQSSLASPASSIPGVHSVTSPSRAQPTGQFPAPVTLLPTVPSAASQSALASSSLSPPHTSTSTTRAKIEQRRNAASRGSLTVRDAAASATTTTRATRMTSPRTMRKRAGVADALVGPFTAAHGPTVVMTEAHTRTNTSNSRGPRVNAKEEDAHDQINDASSMASSNSALLAERGSSSGAGDKDSDRGLRTPGKKKASLAAASHSGTRQRTLQHSHRPFAQQQALGSRGASSNLGKGDRRGGDADLLTTYGARHSDDEYDHRSERRSTASRSNNGRDDDDGAHGPIVVVLSFLKLVLHSFRSQSLFSQTLTVVFHSLHILIMLTLVFSPMLLRTTMFSSQTLSRTLLEAQGDLVPSDKGNDASGGRGGDTALPTSVAVENVWAIHDAIFFLEPGHTVVATDIEDSFQTISGGRHRKKKGSGKKSDQNDEKNGDAKNSNDGDDDDDDDDTDRTNKGGVGYLTTEIKREEQEEAERRQAQRQRGQRALSEEGIRDDDDDKEIAAREVKVKPMKALASAPSALTTGDYRLGSRKKSTKGKNSLGKVASAWEASPLYSSPLALSLYYYLYCIAVAVVLMTITRGRLTGHLAIVRIVVVTSELFWYLHHGLHSFVVYVWLVAMSHWPRWLVNGKLVEADQVFLRKGTPYAAIGRRGEVQFHWYYTVDDATKDGMRGVPVVQRAMDMDAYLYNHDKTIAIIAKVMTALLLITFFGCWLRDATRVLYWLAGVQSIWEPEGMARCPLCGQLMEPMEAVDHHRRRRQSRFAWLFPFGRHTSDSVSDAMKKRTRKERRSKEECRSMSASCRSGTNSDAAVDGGQGTDPMLVGSRDARSASLGQNASRTTSSALLLEDASVDVATTASSSKKLASRSSSSSASALGLCDRVFWWSLGPVAYTWRAVGRLLRSRRTREAQAVDETSRSGFYLKAGKPVTIGPRYRRHRRRDEDELTSSSSATSSNSGEEETTEGDELSVSTDTTEEDEKEGGIVRVIPQTTTGGGAGGNTAPNTTSSSALAATASTTTSTTADAQAVRASNKLAHPTRQSLSLSAFQTTSGARSRKGGRRRTADRHTGSETGDSEGEDDIDSDREMSDRGDRAIRTRLPASTVASLAPPQGRLSTRFYHREQRVKDERAYLRHTTRHVHHRCPVLHLDAVSSSEESSTEDDEEDEDEEDDETEEEEEEEEPTDDDEDAMDVDRRVNSQTDLLLTAPAPANSTGESGTTAVWVDGGRTRGRVPAVAPSTTTVASSVAGWLASTPVRAGSAGYDALSAPSRVRRGPKASQPRLQIPETHAPSALARSLSGSLTPPVTIPHTHVTGSGSVASARRSGTATSSSRVPVHDTFAGGAHNDGSAPRGGQHIVARGRYDPFDDEDDELRPGNAFPCYERANFLSYMTLSWLNAFIAFAMLEPTLLRNERFLPALPKQETSLNNMLAPAWLLWVNRRVWYKSLIAPPEGVLIPTEEVLDRAEEYYWPTPLNAGVTASGVRGGGGGGGAAGGPNAIAAETEESEESSETRTVVLLGQQSGHKAINNVNLRAQRPRRGRAEKLLMTLTTPFRFILRKLFMWFYISRSHLIQRTQQRLIRALLKDRLTHVLEDQGAPATMEEGVWLLAEMASTETRSSGAESTGSLLPSHMRHQLALGDVGLFRLFLEHRAGRRFLFVAGPLLLLYDLLSISIVPALGFLIHALSPHTAEASSRTSSVAKGTLYADNSTTLVIDFANAFSACSLLFVVLFLQSVVYQHYGCQVQQAAMEARTIISSVVLEKVFALPLAQRIFSEEEVVHLVAVEAGRCAELLTRLHHTWSNPLFLLLAVGCLWMYLSWQPAAVALAVLLVVIPVMRRDSARTREKEREAPDVRLRFHLLDAALASMRQVKALVMEAFFVQRIRELRHSEAIGSRRVASAVAQAMLTAEGGFAALIALCILAYLYCGGQPDSSSVLPALMALYLMWTPLTEFPSLFVDVAKGYLSVKRLEAFMRQAPDEFVGTWIDLTAMRQQWEERRRRRRAQRHAQRAKTTVAAATATDAADGSTKMAAHANDNDNGADDFEPGQWESDDDDIDGDGRILYRRGSLVCRGASFTWQHDLTQEDPRPLLKDVHMTVMPGELVVVQGPAGAGKSSLLLAILGEINRCVDIQAGNEVCYNVTDDDDTISELSVVSFSNDSARGSTPQFFASPHEAPLSAMSLGSAATDGAAGDRGGGGSSSMASSARGGRDGRHTSFKKPPPRTESFRVFGSCVYTAETSWLLNDTVRANITAGGITSDVRWYHVVVRACALDKDFAKSLPNGDQTVVGDKGFALTSSQKVRIALARAVFTRADIYLVDSIFTVMDTATRAHVVQFVFHKLLRNKTVIVASNVALASLMPHRVFTVLNTGLVREDTQLYKTIASPRQSGVPAGARGSKNAMEEEEEELVVESPPDDDAHNQIASLTTDDTTNGDDDDETVVLPNLYAEEIEEPEVSETEARQQDGTDDAHLDAAEAFLDEDEEANECEWWRRSTSTTTRRSDDDDDTRSGTSSSGSDTYDTSSWSEDDAVSDDDEQDVGGDGIARVAVQGATSDESGVTANPAATTAPTGVKRHHHRRSRHRRHAHERRARHRHSTRYRHRRRTDDDSTEDDDDEARQASGSSSSNDADSESSGEDDRQDRDMFDDASEDDGTDSSPSGRGSHSKSQTNRSDRDDDDDRHTNRSSRRRRLRRRRRRAQKAHIASHHEAQSGLEPLRLLLIFIGGQSVWLLLGALVQQLLRLSLDVWIGYFLAAAALTTASSSTLTEAEAEAAATLPKDLRNEYGFAIVFGGLVVALMLVVRVRVPYFFAHVFGPIHALYQQAVERVFLASPQLFLSPRIPRVLLGILTKDMNIAEHAIPASAEVLISYLFQCATVALFNALVNPCFLLVLPICYFLFERVSLSFSTVSRELRRLESRCQIGTITILREVYQGAPIIRCLSLQDRLREEYCHSLDITNTAIMTHYMVERWTALRLQWVTVLTATTAGMLGVLFSHPQRRPLAPSFVGVAVIACLRLSRVLPTLCRRSSHFNAQWMPLQRLMELLRLPVEPLTARGKTQLTSHSGLAPQLREGLATDAFEHDTTIIHFVPTTSQDDVKHLAERLTKSTSSAAGGVSAVATSTSRSIVTASPTRGGSRYLASPLLCAAAASISTAQGGGGGHSSPGSDAINVVLPALELVQVSARYRRSLPLALNHMDLVVYPRERLGIIGPSGHGKSTIFNVLLRLMDELVDGAVYVHGEDVDYVPYPILRSSFVVVPEEPVVVDGTWRENLLYGYHPHSPFDLKETNTPWLLPLPTQFAKKKKTEVDTSASAAAAHTRGQHGEAATPLVRAGETQRPHYGAVDHRDDSHVDVEDDMVFGDSFTHPPPPHQRVRESTDKPFRPGAAGVGRSTAAGETRSVVGSRQGRLRQLMTGAPPQGPLQAAEDAALWAALTAVGLQQVAVFDGGLDAEIASGELADLEWSLSQRRLLCMARAVFHKPPILLVEDAHMGSSDPEADAILIRLLQEELKDTTVLFIGHRQRLVCELCTRVVVVEHGRVAKTIEPHTENEEKPSEPHATAKKLRFTDEAKRDIMHHIE